MARIDIRKRLDELISESGETYSAVSRLLGRNSSYIQQFIKRGSPLRLHGTDVARLALHFGVPLEELGGDSRPTTLKLSPIATPVRNLSDGAELSRKTRLLDRIWLERFSDEPSGVEVVVIEGEAMSPTLKEGDEVLIQRLRRNHTLRDGLYVIEGSRRFLVRRVAIEPVNNRVSILTDNPAYPDWASLQRKNVKIVGKVFWIGRRP